jgi:hypothetical protein
MVFWVSILISWFYVPPLFWLGLVSLISGSLVVTRPTNKRFEFRARKPCSALQGYMALI